MPLLHRCTQRPLDKSDGQLGSGVWSGRPCCTYLYLPAFEHVLSVRSQEQLSFDFESDAASAVTSVLVNHASYCHPLAIYLSSSLS